MRDAHDPFVGTRGHAPPNRAPVALDGTITRSERFSVARAITMRWRNHPVIGCVDGTISGVRSCTSRPVSRAVPQRAATEHVGEMHQIQIQARGPDAHTRYRNTAGADRSSGPAWRKLLRARGFR